MFAGFYHLPSRQICLFILVCLFLNSKQKSTFIADNGYCAFFLSDVPRLWCQLSQRWKEEKWGLQQTQFAVSAVTAFEGCISSGSCGVCSPQKTGATACCQTLISACRDSAIKLLSRLIKLLKAKVWNADMLERNTFPLRIKYKSVAESLFSSLLIQA